MSKAQLEARIRKVLAPYGKPNQPKTEGNKTVTSRLRKLAIQGDAAAQYRLACCYDEGETVNYDPATARMWWLKAAKAGHLPAMFRLGQDLLGPDGFEPNRVQGLFWLLKAANSGSREACALLGVAYYNGDRLPKSDTLAAKWFREGANRGCTLSMLSLAHCYDHGRGVTQCLVKSYACRITGLTRSHLTPISQSALLNQMTLEQIEEAKRLCAQMLRGGTLPF